jgi:hypothetical protein
VPKERVEEIFSRFCCFCGLFLPFREVTERKEFTVTIGVRASYKQFSFNSPTLGVNEGGRATRSLQNPEEKRSLANNNKKGKSKSIP